MLNSLELFSSRTLFYRLFFKEITRLTPYKGKKIEMKSQWLQKDSHCLKLHLNFNKWFGTVLLLFARYAILMYVDCINRYLSEMQLHNLPPGIFDGNTKLRFLWVTFICRYDFLNSGLPTSESYTLFKNLRYVKFKGEKKILLIWSHTLL